MTRGTVQGSFEVRLTPAGEEEFAGGVRLARFALRKEYRGGLCAKGVGHMVTAKTPVEGSAGYVAIERVEGTIDGRRGSFVLQHSGMMSRDGQRLSVGVVPDSGTDELGGIEGELELTVSDGEHSYRFEYRLPEVR